jgi:uncharacterized protein
MESQTTKTGLSGATLTLVTVLLIGVAGFVVGTLFTIAAIGLFSVIGINVADQPVLRIVIGVITLQGLGFGSVALFYLLTSDDGFGVLMVSVPDLSDVIWITAGLIGLFASLIAINFVQTFFGIESAEHGLIELGTQNPEILLVLVPLSILLVGPGEELLFRGVIQQLLRIRFGVAIGIAIASIIFSVAHVGSLSGEGLLPTLLTYVVLSLILGGSYEYSKNLVVPAMIHGLFNAIQFSLVYWVATTGNSPLFLII